MIAIEIEQDMNLGNVTIRKFDLTNTIISVNIIKQQ